MTAVDGTGHVCVRLGDHVLDLNQAASHGLIDPPLHDALLQPRLNELMQSGRAQWSSLRRRIVQLMSDSERRITVEPLLVPVNTLSMLMPFEVADYVDFYSSEQHAKNVSEIFGPGAPYLPEHWHHMPIAYHGRAGTVVVSGTPIRRPHGQRRRSDEINPTYGPSHRLDIEAEVGFVVGVESSLGQPLRPDEFEEHVFGVVLVNDWSARDLQAWESTPLGPFLGKSFATSISPWVVPLDALRAARKPIRTQSPAVLPYLHDVESWCLDLRIEIRLNGTLISEPPFASHYWSPGQQLAHLTSNGAALRPGDLFASGTVTGAGRRERGSLLELTWGGQEPLTLDDGTARAFLEDGDVVSITASAPDTAGGRLTLGEVIGRIERSEL
ncbi:MAG: fumarylacetoacetate hydrolase family protein [Actinomycetes bacterium]